MRLRDTRTRIGTGLLRGGGQVAASVAATLIATGLFTLWRPAEPPKAPAAEMTAGGKFGARIGGAEPPATEPERPRLSIVDWAITPVSFTRLVSDVAWRDPAPSWSEPAKPAEPRPAPKPHRRLAAAAPVAPVAPAPAAAHTPVSVAAAEPSRDLLASAADTAASVASGARRAAVAVGSGALQLGAGAMGRLAGLMP